MKEEIKEKIENLKAEISSLEHMLEQPEIVAGKLYLVGGDDYQYLFRAGAVRDEWIRGIGFCVNSLFYKKGDTGERVFTLESDTFTEISLQKDLT
jgi:hypothetical protein